MSPSMSFPWCTLGRRESTEELQAKCLQMRTQDSFLKNRPLITVVIPYLPAQSEALQRTIESLNAQSYERVQALPVLLGEGETVTSAVSRVQSQIEGAYFGLLSPGDWLSPVALSRLVWELQGAASVDLVYADEAVLAPGCKRIASFFQKAKWNVFDLWHFNSVGRPWIISKKRFEALGFAEAAGRHAEHDLFLRLSGENCVVKHVPWILAYRAPGAEVLQQADALLEERVQNHLNQSGVQASVRLLGTPAGHTLKVTPAIPAGTHRVTAIICFKDKADWTIECLSHLEKQAGQVPLEVLLVNNRSQPEQAQRVREAAGRSSVDCKVIDYPAPFNFADMHHRAVADHAKGDFLLLLNNDVFWKGEKQLDEMVAWAAVDQVATVGTTLRYPNGRLQHAGFNARPSSAPRLARLGHHQLEGPLTPQTRTVFGSTFALCLVRRELFERLGGLRPTDLPNGFGDVALQFQALRQGYQPILLGHIEGVHLESASRGVGYEYWEEATIESEFARELQVMVREDWRLEPPASAWRILKHSVGEALRGFLREQGARKLTRGSYFPNLPSHSSR